MSRSHHPRPVGRLVAWILVPLVLLFGQSGVGEVFHPVEEAVPEVDAHHRVDESAAAVHEHDTPSFAHDHHACAHAHALAQLPSLKTFVGSAGGFAVASKDRSGRPASAVFTVLDRGPPVFL